MKTTMLSAKWIKSDPMSVTSKALFIIERNLSADLTLNDISQSCGVSSFHLAHAFGRATGLSVMNYLRSRRLAKSASSLASGASDILNVALDCGYASHEAFSRAFKMQFGKTPEDVRKSKTTKGLSLVNPLKYSESKSMVLKDPVICKKDELLFVGLSQHIPFAAVQNIARQWQLFMSGSYGAIANKIAEPPVGITAGSDENGVDYICAAGVSKFGSTPKECIRLTLAPATYAVFAHDGHVTEIPATYSAIWNDWFPNAGATPAEAPGFERHNETFDPRTGGGGIAIWIPINT